MTATRAARALFIWLILVVSGPAVAQTKLSVAVLDLEIATARGNVSAPETRAVRDELGDALQERVSSDSAENPYRLLPGPRRDLVELKVVVGCGDKGDACMAAIGRILSADLLLYGHIERSEAEQSYQVVVNLLDIAKQKVIRSASRAIPFANADAAALDAHARSMYAALTDIQDARAGSLSVRANASAGRILVSGPGGARELALIDGGATVGVLAPGTYTVRISADGHEPYETEIAIAAGETTTLKPELVLSAVDDNDAKPGKGRPDRVYRVLFGVSAAVAVTGAAGFTLGALRAKGAQDDKEDAIAAVNPAIRDMFDSNNGDVCATADASSDPSVAALQDVCDRIDSGGFFQYMGLTMLAVGAVASGVLYIKGFAGSKRPASSRRETARLRDIRIAPAIAPHFVGTQVQLSF